MHQCGTELFARILVNYDLRTTDLANAATIPDYKLCVAEAFVRFERDVRTISPQIDSGLNSQLYFLRSEAFPAACDCKE